MDSASPIHARDSVRRIQLIQAYTIAWMAAETCFSLIAAWRAGSPALLAFGGDSAIELLSAGVLLWRFRTALDSARAEKWSARSAGALLIALAGYVAAISTMKLLGHAEPRPSYLGIVTLLAATAVMPWLAREKRRLSAATESAALRADAAQSGLCAYLSVVALVGLAANAIWRVPWADPLAALVIVPFIVWEAIEAFRGRPCDCA